MNPFDAFVAKRKLLYTPGMRLQLIAMSNDPHPVPSGTYGTVDYVDDIGTIHVTWDNGSCLGLVKEDKFQVVLKNSDDS